MYTRTTRPCSISASSWSARFGLDVAPVARIAHGEAPAFALHRRDHCRAGRFRSRQPQRLAVGHQRQGSQLFVDTVDGHGEAERGELPLQDAHRRAGRARGDVRVDDPHAARARREGREACGRAVHGDAPDRAFAVDHEACREVPPRADRHRPRAPRAQTLEKKDRHTLAGRRRGCGPLEAQALAVGEKRRLSAGERAQRRGSCRGAGRRRERERRCERERRRQALHAPLPIARGPIHPTPRPSRSRPKMPSSEQPMSSGSCQPQCSRLANAIELFSTWTPIPGYSEPVQR